MCVWVCVCYNIFQMCAPCHLDSTGCTVCVFVCVCARACVHVCACVCVCACYNIFQMCAPCHVDSANYTVCLCVCVYMSEVKIAFIIA